MVLCGSQWATGDTSEQEGGAPLPGQMARSLYSKTADSRRRVTVDDTRIYRRYTCKYESYCTSNEDEKPVDQFATTSQISSRSTRKCGFRPKIACLEKDYGDYVPSL